LIEKRSVFAWSPVSENRTMKWYFWK